MKSSRMLASQQLTKEQLADLRALDKQCQHPCKMYWAILEQERPQINMFMYYQDEQLQGFFTFYLFDTIECALLLANSVDETDFFKQLVVGINNHFSTTELQPFLLSRLHGEKAPCQQATLSYSEFHMQRQDSQQIHFEHSPINMRQANINDNDNIIHIDKACFSSPSTTLESRLSNLLIDPGYYIGMAELNQRVIGKIHLQFEADKAVIYDFAILPVYQGQGYGSALLKLAINYCLVKNIDTIELDVEVNNTSAIALYQKCGFNMITGYDFWLIDQLADLKEEKQ